MIWHITGDIIRAYKQKLIEEIANFNRSLTQQTELITETSAEKYSEEIHVNVR